MNEIQSSSGRYYVEEQGNVQAEVNFSSQGDGVISIDHTFVSPELRGQGVAEQLIRKVIEYARQEQLKIIPACAYASHHFEKFPDDRDLLQQ
ncbi:GNAT family N-acetyltransferase [Paenibacillus lemnae]|uniref:N-acetyltransferase n=1 Tax=Paenibacillus lemnae TaxID=1330551 RepID=A0A848MAA8_PAELE|nr:GNAT family N-acetyltransferase [Paenibacillus lemnae]NMO97012.1 N-acetyltransferase [Paenibacillus lemnae]